jgi:hypothetical protein
VIRVDARCGLNRVLVLRVEAPDERNLQQIEQRVTDRLEQVGRRDRLRVTWTPADDGRTHT